MHFNLDLRGADTPKVELLIAVLRVVLLKKQFDDSPVLTYLFLWQLMAILLVVSVAGWHVLWPF